VVLLEESLCEDKLVHKVLQLELLRNTEVDYARVASLQHVLQCDQPYVHERDYRDLCHNSRFVVGRYNLPKAELGRKPAPDHRHVQ